MAQPVWLLSVDLQTRTATFQTGLADAARSARSAFNDIKGGASEMGGRASYSMMEARHSVMMLGEEFGVHLPRSLTMFLAGLGPIGPALEAAFPFLAIATMAGLLMEHLNKLHEAGEKLSTDQMNFQTAANNALNALNEKFIQAEIRADDLSGNHLSALRHQLELIDHQSLSELQHAFLELAKAAEPVMKDLEGHWYTFGEGSDGAKHALDDFRTHYALLLSQGKGDEASGLLHGTLEQAKQTLAMMDQLKASRGGDGKQGNYQAYEQANTYLEKMGVLSKITGDYTQTTYDAQMNLVSALQDQVSAEGRIADIKKLEQQNAVTKEHKDTQKDGASAAKQRAEFNARIDREYLENFKRDQQALIDATRSGTQERLDALQTALSQTAELYGKDNATYRQYAAEYTREYNDMADKTLAAIGKELDEEDKLRAEGVRQQIAADTRAQEERQRHIAAMMRIQAPKRGGPDADDQRAALDQEYAEKRAMLERELQDTQKMGRERVLEEQRIRQQMLEVDQEYQDRKAELAEDEKQKEKAAAMEVTNSFAQSMLQVAEGHQQMARVAEEAFQSIIAHSLEAALMQVAGQETVTLANAKAAASGAMSAVAKIPVVGPALAPIAGAAVFAAALAFEKGGEVPGVGRGDIVPAMLTPGEGIVPGGVMDGLRSVARNGGFQGQGHTTVVHVQPTYHVNTIDGDGMREALEKHSDQLHQHFENTLRKMNR